VILVVSHPGDEHARAVLAALGRRRVRARLLDLAHFPRRLGVTLPYGTGAGGPTLTPRRGPPLRLDAVEAVWWRRPRPFELHEAIRDLDRFAFAWRESREAFAGMWLSLRCRWVNHPARDRDASHKAWQLALARRLGLRVPRTCITSDPAAARAFLAGLGRVGAVMKTLQASPGEWQPTRMVDARVRRRLGLVRRAPVIFQEYVPGVDVRVTVVGRRLFCASIDSRQTRSPEDFRLALDESRIEPIRLPTSLRRRLLALIRGLDLRYAAVDLRRSESGDWIFLEVNPAGQWLFVEERTGLPITDAVARLLATGR
jgi:hypothetical protein